MPKIILTLCYGGAAVWLSVAVLGWLAILPPAHSEHWPIAAIGGMTLLFFGVLFHRNLNTLLALGRFLVVGALITVGPFAAAAQAECRDSRSQEECDLRILSQKLTEAGLPASPADIIGKAFCASIGGGSSWCGTVVSLTLDYRSWPGGNLNLRVETGSASPTHAVFSFDEKKWRVSDRPVDWISVVTK